MRIGYLVSQYPAINHTFVLREIQALRDQGFEIAVVSVRAPDRPPESLAPEERAELAYTTAVKSMPLSRIAGLHAAALFRHPLRYWRGFGSALRLGSGLRGSLRHVAYFAEAVVVGCLFERAGITHFHVHFSSTVGLLAAKVFPLTMSNTFHGPDEFLDPAGFHTREKVEASRFVVAISSFGRSQIQRACDYSQWPKIELSRLGVDPDLFAPRPARESARLVELLSVGRLAPVKGQHVLIDAVACLRAGGHNVHLCLAGDGPDRASLEQHVRAAGLDRAVTFAGWCNQDRIRGLYRDTDIFVMASFAEGIPVVLMEAMAMEIPAVATYVAGIPELIDHQRTGMLVPASDSCALARAIASLIRDPQLARSLGMAGRQKVLRDFHLAGNARSLAAIFSRRLLP